MGGRAAHYWFVTIVTLLTLVLWVFEGCPPVMIEPSPPSERRAWHVTTEISEELASRNLGASPGTQRRCRRVSSRETRRNGRMGPVPCWRTVQVVGKGTFSWALQ